MLQIRDGELANTEIPVRVSRPIDVEIVAPVESQLHVLALQFIDDGTVIDPLDRNVLAVALVIEVRPLLLDIYNIDCAHA